MNNKEQEELMNNGFVELPTLAYDDSTEIFENIENQLDKTYNSNTEFHDEYLKKHNILTDLKESLFELAKKQYGIKVNKNDIYTITRVVKSFDGYESYRGHFDSHLFTLVTPVIIPKANDPESGQLIVFPKIRKEPTNEFINILGKLKYKLFYSKEKSFKNLMKNKNYKEFDFTNLNPVLFLGRQSFHGNRSFAKAPDGIRVTLLTHFFED